MNHQVIYDDNDLRAMALCVWKEARGEGGLGMQAIANVISNRIRSWYKAHLAPVHDAVYAKNQFTSMSVPTDRQFNVQPSPGDAQFDYCMNICGVLLDSYLPEADPTHGALYYCNLAQVTSGWFAREIVANTEEHPQLASIGKQIFYR